jgi:hypothetical protein
MNELKTKSRASTKGAGNPFGRRLAALRAVVVDSVTEDDLRAILTKLVEQAKAGDLASIREVLNRVVGRPADGRDPDRVNIEAITLEANGYEAERHRKNSKPSIFERIATDDDDEEFIR